MEFQKCLVILVLSLMGFLGSSQSYKFYVGGRDGWVLKPSEPYSHWAERNRFSVNDTLFFKYKKGSDSVLVVNKENYFNCNTSSPIQSLKEGDSEFKFERSGPFFFISGFGDNCLKGQRLIIVVLAVRSKTHPAPPSLSPSPSQSQAPIVPPSSGNPPLPSPSLAPWSPHSPAPAQSSSPRFQNNLVVLGSCVSVVVSVLLGGFVGSSIF
ncbi:Phytocyanin domain [Dillenia turbinata]|uniref:Phytocyanin domain n=1 Tax=Dillenia turbinata TaxID=194707 RepID=A0AAN8UUT7_9MAGN